MRFLIGLFFVVTIASASFAKDFSPQDCPVVGNKTSARGKDGKKIYHVSGGQFYEMMLRENAGSDNRDCFSSEEAAQRAGYRKSKR